MRTLMTVATVVGFILAGCDGGGGTDAGHRDSGMARDGGGVMPDAGDRDGGSRQDAGRDAGADSGSGAGTDAGSDAGSDAGADAGTDSGSGATDGGTDAALGDGGTSACATAPVQIMDTCPAFSACGGAVSGTWCYTGVCVTTAELLGDATSLCPTITLTTGSGMVTGRVEFAGSGASGTVTRQVSVRGSGSVFVPQSCLDSFAVDCAGVESLAPSFVPPSVTITCASATGGGCNCAFVLASDVNTMDAYDLVGNVIVTHPPAGDRRFDYCVETDGSLRFHETTADGELGTQSLAPAAP